MQKDGTRDLIDRQAAIDVAYKYKADIIAEEIEDSPSAQPEIIHCRDCIQSLFSGLGCDRVYCMKHSHYMYEDDFCSYAVRESNGTS